MPQDTEAARRLRANYGPGWRWQVAKAVKSAAELPARIQGNKAIGMAVEFLNAREQPATDSSSNAVKAVAKAGHLLWMNSEHRFRLKMLVIGSCSVAEIRQRISTRTANIKLAELLFFDIRPLEGAFDWLQAQAGCQSGRGHRE